METFNNSTDYIDSLCERHVLMKVSDYIPRIGTYNKLKIHKFGDHTIIIEASDIRHSCVYPFMMMHGLNGFLASYMNTVKGNLSTVNSVSLEHGDPVMYMYVPTVTNIDTQILIDNGFQLCLPSVSHNRLGGVLPQKCSEWMYRYVSGDVRITEMKIKACPKYPYVEHLEILLERVF